ncbi:recombinase family protein [Clostridium sulfidigenes]
MVVRKIYDLYLEGYSVDLIIRDLERLNIKSPMGTISGLNKLLKQY